MLPRFPKKATGRNCPCGPWRSFGRACDILVSLRDTTMFSDRRARGSKSRNLNHANAVTPSRTRSSRRGDRRAVLKSSKVSKAFLDRGEQQQRDRRRDGRVFADRSLRTQLHARDKALRGRCSARRRAAMHRLGPSGTVFAFPSRCGSSDYSDSTAPLLGPGDHAIVRRARSRSRHGTPAQADRASAKDSPIRCPQVKWHSACCYPLEPTKARRKL